MTASIIFEEFNLVSFGYDNSPLTAEATDSYLLTLPNLM
jgi:hypothetical protein